MTQGLSVTLLTCRHINLAEKIDGDWRRKKVYSL